MDNKLLTTVLPAIKIGIIALGILFVLLILFGGDGMAEGVASFGLVVTYIVTVIAAIAALGFGIQLFLKNIKTNKMGLYGVLGFIGIMLLSYLVASSDVPAIKEVVTAGTAKTVSGGLISVYIFLFGAVGAIAFSEIKKVLK
jgi:hypothetical protein